MNNTNPTTAQPQATGRGSVTRLSQTRRTASSRPEVLRARDALRQLQTRQERFAHLKQMHD